MCSEGMGELQKIVKGLEVAGDREEARRAVRGLDRESGEVAGNEEEKNMGGGLKEMGFEHRWQWRVKEMGAREEREQQSERGGSSEMAEMRARQEKGGAQQWLSPARVVAHDSVGDDAC
ncbi:hypothetical protein AMTR_s00020p00223670 [Amborella trichopoda]|uniref:Uncharacterized protein n=1 Tax=Amborella trichopoda TaxID=13333 RepID=W1PW06_AMBTC|nr:hypothetical protein AMTR_s00020p00223670 [Amborella trichopoda]